MAGELEEFALFRFLHRGLLILSITYKHGKGAGTPAAGLRMRAPRHSLVGTVVGLLLSLQWSIVASPDVVREGL